MPRASGYLGVDHAPLHARGMGGELSAESEVGRGATFTLTLRAADHTGADRRVVEDRRDGDEDRRSHEERRGHLEPNPTGEYLGRG